MFQFRGFGSQLTVTKKPFRCFNLASIGGFFKNGLLVHQCNHCTRGKTVRWIYSSKWASNQHGDKILLFSMGMLLKWNSKWQNRSSTVEICVQEDIILIKLIVFTSKTIEVLLSLFFVSIKRYPIFRTNYLTQGIS